MNSMTFHTYANHRFLSIESDEPKDWNLQDASLVRVTLPADTAIENTMRERGFVLVDRTLEVTIELNYTATDFSKLCRMAIIESDAFSDDILRIARLSFIDDRRFYITLHPDMQVADQALKDFVSNIDKSLVCFYKEKPIGFLALKAISPQSQFVYLAAVESEYRATGAALSLYAKAALLSKDEGFSQLKGRISSKNIAVINLYSYLGATFSTPLDTFLLEV
jgi:hypothetical protein